MKQIIFILIFLISTINAFSCECECNGDCAFYDISSKSNYVILVKVKSFVDIDSTTFNPHSMILEVIRKYKGIDERKEIKIWDADGLGCREDLHNFKKNEYYLMTPQKLTRRLHINDNENDFELSECVIDYLKVDMGKEIAYGEYTEQINQIKLSEFENKFK